MVVDTSALVAIMGDEPERRRFNQLIEAATATYVSVANLLETRIVLFARSGDSAVLALDAFLLKSGMNVMEVSPRIADLAFDAYRRYDKGPGHSATLNYGDCFPTPWPSTWRRHSCSRAMTSHRRTSRLRRTGGLESLDLRTLAIRRRSAQVGAGPLHPRGLRHDRTTSRLPW